MTSRIQTASAPSIRVTDAFVVLWVVLWLGAGVLAGYQIWQLTSLSTSVVESGNALGTAGGALKDLGGVPLIGEGIGKLGDEVNTTATGIVDSGRRSEASIRVLALILGTAIGLGPAGPVLLLYLPARLARRRTRLAVNRALRDPNDQDQITAHLARQAVVNLDFQQLMMVTRDPAADLAAGRYSELAGAELRRLGLNLR
ncbi:MAG: hypothetical protein ABIW80_06245 [Lapillicoccus sp.]